VASNELIANPYMLDPIKILVKIIFNQNLKGFLLIKSIFLIALII
jgi:hypothetical protein